MKRIFAAVLAALITMPLLADNTKLRVAVFDPSSSGTSIDEGTKVAIREIISSTMVNSGNFEIVERSLLEKVMQEQSFSNSGAVNDTDATEIGKLAGANKVVISVVTLTGGRNMLSVKMIDVKTASVDRQKVKVVSSGELLDVIEPLTLALIEAEGGSIELGPTVTGAPAPAVASTPQQTNNNTFGRPIPQPGEVVFWLPAGYQPKKDKDKELPLLVYFDFKSVGSGTVGNGFSIRVPNPGSGVHVLKVGNQAIQVDLDSYDFFELQLYQSKYLGMTIYGVSVKEQKMVNANQGHSVNQEHLTLLFNPCNYNIPPQSDKFKKYPDFPIMKDVTHYNVILDFSEALIEGVNMRDYLVANNKLNEPFIKDMNSEMSRFVSALNDESSRYNFAYNTRSSVALVVKFREISSDGKKSRADYVFVETSSGNVLAGIKIAENGGRYGTFANLLADALAEKVAPEIVDFLKKQKVGK